MVATAAKQTDIFPLIALKKGSNIMTLQDWQFGNIELTAASASVA